MPNFLCNFKESYVNFVFVYFILLLLIIEVYLLLLGGSRILQLQLELIQK